MPRPALHIRSAAQVYLILVYRVEFLHSGNLEDGWNGRWVGKQQFTLLGFAIAWYPDLLTFLGLWVGIVMKAHLQCQDSM